VILMDRRKMILWGVMLLVIGLMLTGCAGYYSGNGYYGYPYYDYGYPYYGYYGFPYYDHGYRRGFGEHHREFGQSPKWGGEHEGSGEHHHDRH
jgi:hypothetical protein